MNMCMTGSPTKCLIAAAGLCLGAGQQGEPQLLEPIEQTVEDVSLLAESLRILQMDLQQPAGFTNVYRVPGQPDWIMRRSGAVFAVSPLSEYAWTEAGDLALIPANTVFYIGRSSLDRLGVSEGQSADPEAAETEAGAVRYEPRVDWRVSGDPLLAHDLAIEESRPLGERAYEPRPVRRAFSGQSTDTGFARRPMAGIRMTGPGSADGRASGHDGLSTAGRAFTPQPRPGTIEGDSGYRVERIRELMQKAARAEISRVSPGASPKAKAEQPAGRPATPP